MSKHFHVSLKSIDPYEIKAIVELGDPHDCGDLDCPGYQEWLKYQAAGELLEVAKDAIVAIENVVTVRGHHSVLLREHPSPCNRLDFCVMKDALRRALKIKEVIAAVELLEAKAEGQAEGR